MKQDLRRRARRGVTLVEVLIVVAIMAVISGAVTIVASREHARAKIRMAAIGASTIKEAAVIWRDVDAPAEGCPSLAELVSAKKLDPRKIEDPWGSPYQIVCDGDDLHVVSPGRDRKAHTPDDVSDGMKPAELEAIASR